MKLIAFEKVGQIGVLKVNRPKALNALNRGVLEELDAFLSGGIDKEEIRGLVFTGEGKAFIAGGDIKEMQALGSAGIAEFCDLGQRVMNLLGNLNMVVIAAVNGYALGGGLELALACDFIYAATEAKLGQPEVKLGVIPGFGGTQRLARAVGTRLATELITTGRNLDAEEALRIGLVNRVLPADELLTVAIETVEVITRNSFAAVTRAKKAINKGEGLTLPDALDVEKTLFVDCFNTPDQDEGMTAFIEKRAANFE